MFSLVSFGQRHCAALQVPTNQQLGGCLIVLASDCPHAFVVSGRVNHAVAETKSSFDSPCRTLLATCRALLAASGCRCAGLPWNAGPCSQLTIQRSRNVPAPMKVPDPGSS